MRAILTSLILAGGLSALGIGCSDGASTGTKTSGSGASGGSEGSTGIGGMGVGGMGVGGAAGNSSASGSGGNVTGSGGAGGAVTGSGGSGGSGGGNGIGAPCVGGVGGCDEGLYCYAPGCGAGTCKPKVALGSQTQALVCGCDHVTYWNAEVAELHGSSVKSQGECPMAEAITCSLQMPCTSGLTCNRKVTDAMSCSPQATGVCWGMPISCAVSGPKGKGCISGTCYDQCSLIQSQNPWYDDGGCP